MHMYMYIHIHVHIHTYTCMYMYVCMYMYMYVLATELCIICTPTVLSTFPSNDVCVTVNEVFPVQLMIWDVAGSGHAIVFQSAQNVHTCS